LYFITFTCQDWLSLFEITNSYDAVYKWFDHLKAKEHFYSSLLVFVPQAAWLSKQTLCQYIGLFQFYLFLVCPDKLLKLSIMKQFKLYLLAAFSTLNIVCLAQSSPVGVRGAGCVA
jgi:hypothetical protein